MKIRPYSILLAVTLLFVGFTAGLLAGRNSLTQSVVVSVPIPMQTVPTQTEETEREILFPIDLNTADKEELMALPGIGEKLALRILAYRRERGRFWDLKDLMHVEGITWSILEEIEDLVIVGG